MLTLDKIYQASFVLKDVVRKTALQPSPKINPKSEADPVAGEWIYIEQKQSKWQGEGSSHRVATGETLTSIAQEYGIREKRLRSMNRLKSGTALVEGQMLKLN